MYIDFLVSCEVLQYTIDEYLEGHFYHETVSFC